MSKYIKLEDAIGACREKQIIEGDAVTGIRYPTPNEIINDLFDLPTIEVSEDCISREYMLRALNGYGKDWQEDCEIAETIRNAPSVVPKRSCYRCGLREDCEDSTERESKEGEWIKEYNGNGWNDYWDYTCPNCGKKYERADSVLYDSSFCPNCGAKIKGERGVE